jgi:hypothetical protein
MRVALARRQCTGVMALLCAYAAVVLASAAGASANSGGVLSAGAGCSKATGKALIDQHSLNGFLLPPAQVLCGPFTGPGSNAMAVTIAAGTCWSPQGLAVFSFSGGSWRLVLSQRAFIVPPLVAVGSDIRETTRVFRPGESGCNPTVTQTRLWHWNGTTLTAKVSAGAAPAKSAESAIVFSPLAYGITCHMTDDGSFTGSWVYCWIGANPHPAVHVKLNLDGRFSLTATTAIPVGLGGRSTPYGIQVTVGRFRCQSLHSGMKCTVIQSGKGFLVNSAGATRVGP